MKYFAATVELPGWLVGCLADELGRVDKWVGEWMSEWKVAV